MSIRRSIVVSVFGRYAGLAIQVAGAIVLARLISPAEFGIYGIAVAVVYFPSVVREFGISNYLIQLPRLTREDLGRAVGLVASISAVGLTGLLLVRGWVAELYGEPRLADLIGIASISFALMPFGIGTIVTLQRELRFPLLTGTALIATLTSVIGGVWLAYKGWGAYSLAWAQVLTVATNLTILGCLRPKELICLPKFSGWGSMVGFGFFSTLASISGQVQSSLVSMLVGHRLGFAAVGTLDRANGTLQYLGRDLLGAMMTVLYVGLAQAKANPRELEWFTGRAVAQVTALLVPAYAMVAVLADPIILTLFGEAWHGVVPLVPVLALGGAAWSFAAVHNRGLQALGRTRETCVVACTTHALVLASVAIVLPWGLRSVVWANTGGAFVWMLGTIFVAHRAIGIRWRGLLLTAAQALVLSAAAAIPAYLVLHFGVQQLGRLGVLIVGGTAGGIAWCLAAFLCRHPIAGEVRRVGSYMLQRVGWRKKAGSDNAPGQ